MTTTQSPWPRAAILGGGSFGTALSVLLSPKLDEILLFDKDRELIDSINKDHRNIHYLREVELPENVRATSDPEEVAAFPLVLFVVPSAATRKVASALYHAKLPPETTILSCSKGIEFESGKRLSEVISEFFPKAHIAAMSGPTHAEEIAQGLATAAVIASTDADLAADLQNLFTLPRFRSYTSDDVAGVELGGAIKNTYAIAAGIAHGLGLGDNASAALVTSALAELTRLGTRLGGRPETFAGLSGVGDLIVTCYSEHSRNHKVGFELGKGATLQHILDNLGMVAEGVPNTRSTHRLARRYDIRTPILDAVFEILYHDKPAAQALDELLSRDPRPETE